MSILKIIDELSKDYLTIIALPIFLFVIILEFLYSKKKHLDLYYGKDSIGSFWMLIFAGFTEFIPKLIAFVCFYHLHQLSPLRDIIERQWFAWILIFVLDDFTYYWFHRCNHEIRIFWAGHIPHHSAIKMNFGTALRQGVGERIHKFLFWLWLPLLGFDPIMIFLSISVNLFYQFWTHTEIIKKLPFFIEYIFNTPSHHRVHHASNIRYLDRNHAGVFILWDRIFGTFTEELIEEKPIYGLTENIQYHHPVFIASHEYRALFYDIKRAPLWSQKFKYIFYAPGWSHDGIDKRAKTLRRQIMQQ